MREILTLKEMKHRYYGEWLLVACTEIDDQLNPIRGEVIAHSLDRDTIYDAITAHRHNRTGTFTIDCEVDRLNWSLEQTRSFLQQTYSKPHQELLTDEELFDFLNRLETQHAKCTEVELQ